MRRFRRNSPISGKSIRMFQRNSRFKWDIGYYIQREFTYLWNLYATAASIGGKVQYSFRTSAVVNRFYRMFRHG